MKKTEKQIEGTGIGEHEKAKNSQLDEEDPGSEVLKERGKNELAIKIGVKENL